MNTNTVTVAPQRLQALRAQGEDVELIDVRTPAEYMFESIEDADRIVCHVRQIIGGQQPAKTHRATEQHRCR